MKRLFIALALLAVTVGLCVGSHVIVTRGVETLLHDVDAMESACHAGDTAAAAAIAAQLPARFAEQTRRFPLFLPHAPLDAAEDSLCALATAPPDDAAAMAAALGQCRLCLERLRDAERLSPANLL